MKNRLNITMLLCQSADDAVKNIKNVFDTVKLSKNSTVTFDIVTSINFVYHEEESFILVYAIEKIKKDNENSMITIFTAKSIRMENLKENYQDSIEEHIVTGTMRGTVQGSFVLHATEMNFPGIGEYELQIYKMSEEEINNNNSIIGVELLDIDKLICTYGFKIV